MVAVGVVVAVGVGVGVAVAVKVGVAVVVGVAVAVKVGVAVVVVVAVGVVVMAAQRLVSYAEDYQGNYWRSSRHAGHRVLTHQCADCGCLWGVTIQRDLLGQWYARHEHSDYSPSLRTGPSTVTSQRFRDWQDAARWAADRGLLGGGE